MGSSSRWWLGQVAETKLEISMANFQGQMMSNFWEIGKSQQFLGDW